MEYITRKTKYSLEYVNFDVNFNETSSKTTHHTQGIRVQIKTETKKSKNIKPEIKGFKLEEIVLGLKKLQFCNLREIENVGFSQTKSETDGLKDGASNVSRSNSVFSDKV